MKTDRDRNTTSHLSNETDCYHADFEVLLVQKHSAGDKGRRFGGEGLD